MPKRWLTRALIALVVPATLAAPALTTSATAAVNGPGVPTVAQVATVYPHFAGGTSSESTSKVLGPGKKCKPGKPIKGASARTASYSAPVNYEDPTSYLMTGARPGVFVSAMRFPTAKAAIKYLHSSSASTKKCPVATPTIDGQKVKAKIKPIRFKLGNERWGYQTTATYSGQTVIGNTLFVRSGKFVVYASAMSMDGTAPSIPQSIQLTKLALSAVR
ncbi:MAG TPA: hypothetical protein VGE38_01405 [Nocardioides sp.]|uniref:hypothetical protein n=1 Tax=Nocardioides sp. TaxID=35761 RepID=UPI002EDA49F7